METKICSKCKIEKESHQFFKIYKNKNKLRSRCKKCDKEYYLNNTNRYNQIRIKNKINKMQYDKIYNTQNKMKAKENKMLNKYKLTLDDWYNMLTNQYNQCYICNNLLNLDNPNNICVDHNHETGQVRKLLCRNCNLAITYNTVCSYCNSRIGKLKENKFILQSAIIYLEEFK